MEVITYFDTLSDGSAVGGMKDTLQALNEGRVQRLIICAGLTPGAGWQCHDCLALHGRMSAAPDKCLHCGCLNITPVDLKSAIIARAYRLGCSIEIVSRCDPPLERVGGIGALLRKR